MSLDTLDYTYLDLEKFNDKHFNQLMLSTSNTEYMVESNDRLKTMQPFMLKI